MTQENNNVEGLIPQTKIKTAEPKLSELEAAQLEAAKLTIEAQKEAIELAKLERLEKTANIQDLNERLAERSMKREDRFQKSRTNGDTLRIEASLKKSTQDRCNHRKGGDGQLGYTNGQGTDPQYAIMKHKVCNGDIWVRCMRCGKNWKPPVETHFKTKEEYLDAYVEYKAALNFPTRNGMSTSYTFKFAGVTEADGVKYFRDQMRSTVI